MKTNDDDYKHWRDSVDSFYSILHLSHEYYCKQKFAILKKTEFIGQDIFYMWMASKQIFQINFSFPFHADRYMSHVYIYKQMISWMNVGSIPFWILDIEKKLI